MRKLIFLICLTALWPSTGCYSVMVQGPAGGMHRVIPFAGTKLMHVYNRCAPLLYVAGDVAVATIPQGGDAWVLVPVLVGDNRQEAQDVIFEAMTEKKQELGIRHILLSSNYYAGAVSRSTFVVGGRGADIGIEGVCGR
jgi:hypothetical protein